MFAASNNMLVFVVLKIIVSAGSIEPGKWPIKQNRV
jgi:hypothetical protein